MDPKAIAEITELMMTLPPEQMMNLQTMIHNSMAGIDVTSGMLEFEKNLPPGFREKLARVLYLAHGVDVGAANSASGTAASMATSGVTPEVAAAPPRDIHEARKVILRGVASGSVTPDDALKLLFPGT